MISLSIKKSFALICSNVSDCARQNNAPTPELGLNNDSELGIGVHTNLASRNPSCSPFSLHSYGTGFLHLHCSGKEPQVNNDKTHISSLVHRSLTLGVYLWHLPVLPIIHLTQCMPYVHRLSGLIPSCVIEQTHGSC